MTTTLTSPRPLPDAGADGAVGWEGEEVLARPVGVAHVLSTAELSRRVPRGPDLGAENDALREADHHKDEFLAQFGHELRNPLASLQNALRLLRDSRDEQAREEALALAERQVLQLRRLVDELMDLSRVAQGKVELHKARIDLTATITRALETTRPALDRCGHHLAVALPPGPVWIEGDAPRLEQVFVNLLTNAVKYTPAGGRLGVTVEREGREVVVRVRDSGIGLSPEVLPRIWALFVQAEEGRAQAEGGLGIGLSLVRGLVALHGGSTSASSDGPGKGSEFVVRLPVPAEVAVPLARDAPAPSPSDGLPLRVLVVDDNREGTACLVKLLQRWGHRVDLARDGPSALTAAKRSRPEIVLLDIGLPGMGGHEVARRLRAEAGLGNALLVALTGYGQEEDREQSREAGCDLHWVKPVDPDALRDLLTRSHRLATAER